MKRRGGTTTGPAVLARAAALAVVGNKRGRSCERALCGGKPARGEGGGIAARVASLHGGEHWGIAARVARLRIIRSSKHLWLGHAGREGGGTNPEGCRTL